MIYQAKLTWFCENPCVHYHLQWGRVLLQQFSQAYVYSCDSILSSNMGRRGPGRWNVHRYTVLWRCRTIYTCKLRLDRVNRVFMWKIVQYGLCVVKTHETITNRSSRGTLQLPKCGCVHCALNPMWPEVGWHRSEHFAFGLPHVVWSRFAGKHR